MARNNLSDLASDAAVEVKAMAREGWARPSSRNVVKFGAAGAVAGVVLPIVTLPVGLVAGAGYALWRAVRR